MTMFLSSNCREGFVLFVFGAWTPVFDARRSGFVFSFLSFFSPLSRRLLSLIIFMRTVERAPAENRSFDEAVFDEVESVLGYLPDLDAPLLEAGLTSLLAVELRDRIQKLLVNEKLDTEMLDVAIFFQVSCIRDLPAAVKCAASVEDELPEVQIQFTGEPLPRWLFWVLQTVGVWQGNTSSRTILVLGTTIFESIAPSKQVPNNVLAGMLPCHQVCTSA